MSSRDPAVRCGSAQDHSSERPEDREGHRKALSDLAKDHHRALLGYLKARTGSAYEAQEIAQETYAKMLALDRPDVVGFLVGYMWKIAGNLVLERRRQRATRARLDQTILFQPTEAFCAPSPESLLYTEQQLKLVEEALNRLPPKCVEAFVLRIVEERSFQEVARHMDISERMAKLYVARAAQFCQSHLNAAEAIERMGQ